VKDGERVRVCVDTTLEPSKPGLLFLAPGG
jgi:hypothetical protein